ncbi:MFS transporter [Neomegalonema sp.]|uniref:MFS transporter n=1 Tax=Neomegalonema sp. TaxID=2039713 RepID=UPI002603BF05|nr:MFS transporter [Neomegalonema sp.]MDD2868412.1 MFS transporter [Neomegalonema sp.]
MRLPGFLTALRGPAVPRTVWMLGFVSLLMDVSSEMVQTLLPLYLVSGLGASALTVGFVEGISAAVATATKFLSGALADRMGRNKPLAVLGYGLGAVSRLILPLAASVDLVLASKAIDRVGKGLRGAPRDALIASVSPPEIRGASFGLRKSLDTVGGFLGPLIAVAAMLLLGGHILSVFWLAAIPAFLAVALLIFGVQEPKGATPALGSAFSFRDSLRLNRAVWTVVGFGCLLTLARFSEAFLLLKALESGFSPVWAPLAMVLLHAAYGLTAYPVGRLSDRIGREGLLIWSLPFLIGAHLALAWAEGLGLYLLGVALWGLHMGFSQGLLGAMIAGAAPEKLKGTAFGAFNLVTSLALLGGSVAAGWLWESRGSAAPFQVGACLASGALLFAVARRRFPG